MIDFEEELKNFKPGLEISEAEKEIHSRDLTDVIDILRQIGQPGSRIDRWEQ